MINPITLHEITSLEDDLLLPWLDLYETAFPPNEKVLVSDHLAVLRDKPAGHHLVAALNQAGEFVGMARYEVCREESCASLWYLATLYYLRNKGLGSWLYRSILEQLDAAVIQALVLEVEIPEECHGADERRLAERRIEFYRRLGARRLGGIHYLQYVGPHQGLTPMHILVQPLRELAPHAAFELAKTLFGDYLQQTGPLALE